MPQCIDTVRTQAYLSITTVIQRLWFSGKIQASHTLLGWSGHSREYCLGPGFDSRWAHRFLTRLLHFSLGGSRFMMSDKSFELVSSRVRSDESLGVLVL